jgi:hypothetical protein
MAFLPYSCTKFFGMGEKGWVICTWADAESRIRTFGNIFGLNGSLLSSLALCQTQSTLVQSTHA